MKIRLLILFIFPYLLIIFPQLVLAGKSTIKDEVLHIPNIDIDGFGQSEIAFDIDFHDQYLFTLSDFTEAETSVDKSGVYDPESQILKLYEIELESGERYSAQLSLLSQGEETVFKFDNAMLLDNEGSPDLDAQRDDNAIDSIAQSIDSKPDYLVPFSSTSFPHNELKRIVPSRASSYSANGVSSPLNGASGSVQWIDQINVSLIGTTLTKIAGCDGCNDASSYSAQQISAGNGYLEFTAGSGAMSIGLNHLFEGTGPLAFDFGLILQGRYAEVWEDSVYVGEAEYSEGDVFRIQINNGQVSYTKNGAVFHTTSRGINYPLRADTKFYQLGSYIDEVRLVADSSTSSGDSGSSSDGGSDYQTPANTNYNGASGSVQWIDQINVSLIGTTLTKIAGCDGCNDASSYSAQQISAGNGYLEFTAGSDAMSIGLNHLFEGTGPLVFDFGLNLQGRYAEVWEDSVYVGEAEYSEGDVFRIQINNGQVSYTKNGAVFHTTSRGINYPLRADTKFYQLGSYIDDVRLVADSSTSSDDPEEEETTPAIVVVPNNQEPLDPDTPPDEESVPVIAVVPNDPEPLYVYIPPSGPADIVVTDDQMSLERYQPIGSEFDLVDAVGIRFYGDPYASVTFRGNVKFNPITDVDLSADTITPSGDFDPRFTTGTAVRYDVITPRGVGGSAMGGLIDGERLWIRVSGDGITLHPTRTDAIHGTNRKDILDLGTGVNHQLNRGCATKDAAWINPDDIDLETDVFYVLDHGFETGALMSWGRWDGGSGVPVGIRDYRYKWYLGDFDGHSFALYRSLEDAVNDVNRVKLYTQESGWLNRANQEIPVRTGTHNIHWSGGIINGGVDTNLDIQDEKDPSGAYCNMSAFLMDAGMTQTVEGVRIMNAWDGLAIYGLPCRFTAPSGCDIVVKDSWFSDISDDAIESDQYGTITVSDVLIERTFACLSMIQGTGPLEDQSATDSINLTNFLCHSRATKRNVEKYGTEFHISSLKLRGEPDNPKWHCTGCVFAFEDYQHPLNRAGWLNMWDNMGDVTDTYFLYLSGDTLPMGFPDPTQAPYNATGITIQTGATAQATWDAARAKFILEHPDLVEY